MLKTIAKGLALVVAIVVALLAFRGWVLKADLAAEDIRPELGRAYIAVLPNVLARSIVRVRVDSEARPQGSRLKLFENGRALGPAHTDHESIRNLGGGRYSHWKDARNLYFSASDGSDPRTNGRRYSFAVGLRLPPAAGWSAVVLLLALAMAQRRQLIGIAKSGYARTRSLYAQPPVRMFIAAALAAALGWSAVRGVDVTQHVGASDIVHEEGHAYQARLPSWGVPWPLRVRVDSEAGPDDSTAQVLENGNRLGPPHTTHTVIRSAGGGGFSHWRDAHSVYFSTSDNSDPRTNGREYTIVARAQGPAWLLLVAAATTFWAFAAARAWARTLGDVRIALPFRVPLLRVPFRAASRVPSGDPSAPGDPSRDRSRDPSRFTFRLPLRKLGEPVAKAGDLAARLGAWLRRNVLPPAIGTVVAVLLVFGIGEAYFRLTRPFANDIWPSRIVEGVGWLFEPNAVVQLTNGMDFWAKDRTNALGFLDREIAAQIPAGACRIAFIGDSFVEAAQVRNEEKVQAVTERLAARRGGLPPVVAAGFGYSGTGQLNQLPFYDNYARNFAPHLVVLVFVANDFANNSNILEALRHGFHPNHAPRVYAARDARGEIALTRTDPEWSKHLLPASSDTSAPACELCATHAQMVSSSLFYRWITLKLRLLAPHLLRPLEPAAKKSVVAMRAEWIARQPEFAGELGSWTGESDIDQMFYQKDLPPAFARAVEFTGFAFAEFKKRVEAGGGRLVVLATSNVRLPDTPNGGYYLERLMNLTQPLGIDVLDQRAWLEAHSVPESAVRFQHDSHWNQRGHEVAAEMTVDYLARTPDACAARR